MGSFKGEVYDLKSWALGLERTWANSAEVHGREWEGVRSLQHNCRGFQAVGKLDTTTAELDGFLWGRLDMGPTFPRTCLV